jgi:hypothetical protein
MTTNSLKKPLNLQRPMLKKIYLIWAALLSFQLSYAQSYGVEPSVLYFKNGDSLTCIVEQSVSYGNIVRYKKLGKDEEFKVAASNLKSIHTAYSIFEVVQLEKKELLMHLLVDGEIKLYSHVTFTTTAPKAIYDGLETNHNPAKILFVLKNDSITLLVTKKSFETDVPRLIRAEPSLVSFINKRILTFEDLESTMAEYNRLRYRKRMARSITGRVLDPQTKKGINGAHVSIVGAENHAKTNVLGYFQLDVLSEDTLRVYHPKYQEVLLPSPAVRSVQFSLPTLSLMQADSIKSLERSHTPEAFKLLVENNLYYPYADRKNNREGLVVANIKIDTAGNVESVHLSQTVGGCGFALSNVLTQVPQRFWRALYLKHSSTAFILPVVFSLNKKTEIPTTMGLEGVTLDPIFFTYVYEKLEYTEGTWEKTKTFRLYNMKYETKE